MLERCSNGVSASYSPKTPILGDIVKGLPLPDQCAAAVFCSHVLEHLPRNTMESALRNTFRMLRPGGLFRLVVPDLQWRAAQYIRSATVEDPTAADTFMQACSLGRRGTPRGFIDRLSNCFGNSAHLWMYDFSSLKMLLEQAGFVGVRRYELGDCEDPKFALVEDADRFFDSQERELAMQAKRPEPPTQPPLSAQHRGFFLGWRISGAPSAAPPI